MNSFIIAAPSFISPGEKDPLYHGESGGLQSTLGRGETMAPPAERPEPRKKQRKRQFNKYAQTKILT